MPEFGFNTPFKEQLDFFRNKLNLPTERWDDIVKSAHDRAFIVAGAGKADLLNDLNRAIEKAISSGTGLEEFRRDFDQIVSNNGWNGWTGQGSEKGEAWRTRVIYQTNMATSYAAGRYKQLTDPAYLKLRPNWKYVHADGVLHPRPLHLAWHGITLPHDHPFWETHFAPNGWGCHCRIVAVDKWVALKQPPEGWDAINPKTGEQIGIDKGFGYAPGASVDVPLRQMVQDKLINYPPAINKALIRDVNRYIETEYSASEFAAKSLTDKAMKDPLWLGFVENPGTYSSVTDVDLTGYLVLFPPDAPRHIKEHHQYDGKGQRPAIAADYDLLMQAITNPDKVKQGDVIDGHQSIILWKTINGETFRWVLQIRQGKRNRSVALTTLAIKTD